MSNLLDLDEKMKIRALGTRISDDTLPVLATESRLRAALDGASLGNPLARQVSGQIDLQGMVTALSAKGPDLHLFV